MVRAKKRALENRNWMKKMQDAMRLWMKVTKATDVVQTIQVGSKAALQSFVYPFHATNSCFLSPTPAHNFLPLLISSPAFAATRNLRQSTAAQSPPAHGL